MSSLPAAVTIAYNGFSFPVETRTEAFSARPVYDTSGRTVKFTTFSITVRTVLAGEPTSPAVTAARRALSKPGKPLYYLNAGMDVLVNVAGVRDVAWGPKPQELSFKPLGGGHACELVWRVETAVPDCTLARYAFAAMEYTFSASYAIDRAGYTTRTIAGRLVVPNNRAGADGRGLLDSPDEYREKLIPALIPGFRQTFGPFTVSEDRTQLDFSVTDEEFKGRNIPPEWVAEVTASHSVKTSRSGYVNWIGTLTAEYELTANAPNARFAVKHFIETLARDRLKPAVAESKADSPRAASGGKGLAIPIAFSMSEPEIYGRRRVALSLTYTLVSDINSILAQSGLWRDVPGRGWRAWAESLAGSAFHPRGRARLEFDVGDDRIIDLCDAGRPPAPAKTPTARTAELRAGGDFDALLAAAFDRPKPDESWLHYRCDVYVEADSGAGVHRLLPAAPLTGKEDVFGRSADLAGDSVDAYADVRKGLGAGTLGGDGGFPRPTDDGGGSPFSPPPLPGGPGGRLDNQIGSDDNPAGKKPARPAGGKPAGGDDRKASHRRVAPVVYLYLVGTASRVGFPIPAPRLTDVEGMEPVPACRTDRGEGFWSGSKFAAGNGQVFTARWRPRYALPRRPERPLGPPPNPMTAPPPIPNRRPPAGGGDPPPIEVFS